MELARVPRPWTAAFVLGCAAAVASGCHSVEATHVERVRDGCGWLTTPLHGIPVTVRLPSHLEIKIIENRYYDPVTQKFLSDNGQPVATRHVLYEVREKEEVFLVDPVRPAAGDAEAHATFENQFFKTLSGKVDDQTIKAVSSAIKDITGEIAKLPGGKSTAAGAADVSLVPIESLVAVREFDVYKSDLSAQVQEFLHMYLNDCNPPCPPPLIVLPAAGPALGLVLPK